MAVAAGYSVYQADQQSKAANKAAAQQYSIEEERATRDQKDNRNNLYNESLEAASSYEQNRQRLKLESLRAQSAAKVASAESGVGGVTSIRSFLSEEISSDLSRSDLETKTNFNQFNINQKDRSISQNYSDRLQNAESTFNASVRQRATALDYGLAAGSAAASAYGGSI